MEEIKPMILNEKTEKFFNEVDTDEDLSATASTVSEPKGKKDDWKFGTVATGNGNPLNLRAEPKRTSTALMMIPDGTIISIKVHDIHWYKVKYNGLEGYCMREFVK